MIYIKVNSSTRLGNWLFQYAVAKSIANGGDVAFWMPDADKLKEVENFSDVYPGARFVTELPDGALVLDGLYQDSRLFNADIVKQSIVMPVHIAQFIERHLGHAIHKKNLVSIHVRRGDYLQLPHRHPFVGKKYLREAMSLFKNAEFMVFSDDMHWCKHFFKGPRFRFAEGNSVLTDLFLMTQCKGGHICSNSTFSWWGAYLGEGKTVFPSMWYGPAVRGEDLQGLYFEGSEVIKNNYTLGLWLKARMCMVKNACGDILRKVGLR